MADQQGDMAARIKDIFVELAAPFEPEQVKVRTQAGRDMHYVTARDVMNRLDDVLGPANWWDDYVPMEHSVVCRLSIRLPDGTVLTKTDAGGFAGMADPGDDDKSGFADGIKRAAVKFGVARYLCRDGVPKFVSDELGIPPSEFNVQGIARMKGVDMPRPQGGGGSRPDFGPPPSRSNGSAPQGNGGGGGGGRGNGGGNGGRQFDPNECPRHGRGLFAWAKTKQEATGHKWVDSVNDIVKSELGDFRIVDLSAEQVQHIWPLITGASSGPG